MQTNKVDTRRKHDAAYFNTRLAGKVVLLVGNDTAVLQTMILQLAQKGADIALICRQLSTETMRLIGEKVEALGQRFLFIKAKELTQDHAHKVVHADQLIQTVVAQLGHLDVFIDLSAQKQSTEANETRATSDQPLPSWPLRQAVFKELAHA